MTQARMTTMRYVTVTSVGLAALLLTGASAYPQAQRATEKPSVIDKSVERPVHHSVELPLSGFVWASSLASARSSL